MSLAKRVGFETLNEFKSEVAYQVGYNKYLFLKILKNNIFNWNLKVRFEKTRTKFTKILFLTEGFKIKRLIHNVLKIK